MDIPWGSEESGKFVTGVGIITSNGPYGHNVMAAEWTHHISYSPGLIMVNVGFNKATEINIKKTKEFGVNLAATDQNVFSSVAGSRTGKEIDKIAVLRDLGAEFYKARKIDVLMLKGAALNVECKMIKALKLGDHTAFVGEAVDVKASSVEPIVYSRGMYWKLTENVKKPDQEFRDTIAAIVEKHRKR